MIYDLQCFYLLTLHSLLFQYNFWPNQVLWCEVEFFETFHRVVQPISYFLLHDVIDTQELRIKKLK